MKADTLCHMGRAAFWREVMVSSPPAAPWGGLSVNYIQLGLCTITTRAGCRSSPAIPFPAHHQLDPKRYSHLAWTQRDILEGRKRMCMWWRYLSFPSLSYFLCPCSQNTPTAAVSPQLQLSDRMFWEALRHFAKKEGGKRVTRGGLERQTATLQIHLSQI